MNLKFGVKSFLDIESNNESAQQFKQNFKKQVLEFNKHASHCGEFLEGGPLDSSALYSRDIFLLYQGESNDVGLISSDIDEIYEKNLEVFQYDIQRDQFGLGLFRKETGLGYEIAFTNSSAFISDDNNSRERFKLTESSLKEYFGLSFLNALQKNFISKSLSKMECYFSNEITFSRFEGEDLHCDTNLLRFFRKLPESERFTESESLWELLKDKLVSDDNQSKKGALMSLCFNEGPFIFDLKQLESNSFYSEVSKVISEYWNKRDERGFLTLLYSDLFESVFYQSFLDSLYSTVSKVTREIQVLLKIIVDLFTNSRYELEARAAMLFQMQLKSYSKGWVEQVVDKHQ